MRLVTAAIAATIMIDSLTLTACSTRPPAHVQIQPAPTDSLPQRYPADDGMLTTDPQASIGNYPPACVSAGYCDPAIDATCTILHVAIDITGTDPADVLHALVQGGADLSAQALAPCPQWLNLVQMTSQ